MDFDDQLRRYFGTTDLSSLPSEALAAGIERMQVELGLEKDRGRRLVALTWRGGQRWRPAGTSSRRPLAAA